MQQGNLLHPFSRGVEWLCPLTARAVACRPVPVVCCLFRMCEGKITVVLCRFCLVQFVDAVCCCRAAHSHVAERRFGIISRHILRCAPLLHMFFAHVGRLTIRAQQPRVEGSRVVD